MTDKLSQISDEVLVALVIDKDQELFEEVMGRYQVKLLRYARYLINDDQAAADVVQEALIKAFVNLKGFDRKKKFSSWVYRIVHNEAVNYLKKKKQLVSLEANEWLREKLGSRENIEEDFSKKESGKLVRQCLKSLAVEYRSVLSLHYLEEKSYEEIAEVLKIPMGTVGIRLKRGKEKLKNICIKVEEESI